LSRFDVAAEARAAFDDRS